MSDVRQVFSLEARLARLQASGQASGWRNGGLGVAPPAHCERTVPERIGPPDLVITTIRGAGMRDETVRVWHERGRQARTVTTGPGMPTRSHGNVRVARNPIRLRPSGGMLPGAVRRANGGV